MEFLVEIESFLPPDDARGERQRLLQLERARAAELSAAGIIKANWKIPASKRRITLWEAPDATALHSLIMSLPTIEWADVNVRPLVPRGDGHTPMERKA